MPSTGAATVRGALGLLGVLLALAAPARAALPDGRAWELVSPVDKNGGDVAAPGTAPGEAPARASASGGAVSWSSAASFGEAAGAPPLSQYVSIRTDEGWQTRNVSPAMVAGAYAGDPYLYFSADLSSALLVNPSRCAAGDPCAPGYRVLELATGALTPSAAEPGSFEGGSADLGRLVFRSGGDLRLWSPPASGLVTLNDVPAASLGAREGAVFPARAYWRDAGGDLRLSEGAASSVQVDAAAGGGGQLAGASADGAVAFFTAAGRLWRFEASTHVATDLTPAGGVEAVLGASADGGAAFYVAGAGLYRWRQGIGSTPIVSGVGDLAPGGAAVAASGDRLLFTTARPLRAGDTNADSDVYEWEARGTGSCEATGCLALISSGRAEGGAALAAASADGDDAFFLTDGSLVDSDPGSVDLYDARVGGGFPEPADSIPCTGDACQALPAPPTDPALNTLLQGLGNPRVHYLGAKRKRCRRGRVRKRGRCVRRRGRHRVRRHRRPHHHRAAHGKGPRR